MKIKHFTILIFSIVFLLAACTEKRPVFPTYQGQLLKIAVIGEPPAIRETRKVNFTILQIDELSPENASYYDAVWIRGESNLEEMAKSKYSQTFEAIKVPIVFEDLKKGHDIYSDDKDGYSELIDFEESDYVSLYVPPEKPEEGGKTVFVKLYKNERDLETIQDVYSRTLESVEQYK